MDGLHFGLPLPSNSHHWNNDIVWMVRERKYQACSVQYCVQQLCTVKYTHI